MIKITLITGATSGLGKSLAKKYVENNENVLLVGRNIDKLKSVKALVIPEDLALKYTNMIDDEKMYYKEEK